MGVAVHERDALVMHLGLINRKLKADADAAAAHARPSRSAWNPVQDNVQPMVTAVVKVAEAAAAYAAPSQAAAHTGASGGDDISDSPAPPPLPRLPSGTGKAVDVAIKPEFTGVNRDASGRLGVGGEALPVSAAPSSQQPLQLKQRHSRSTATTVKAEAAGTGTAGTAAPREKVCGGTYVLDQLFESAVTPEAEAQPLTTSKRARRDSAADCGDERSAAAPDGDEEPLIDKVLKRQQFDDNGAQGGLKTSSSLVTQSRREGGRRKLTR